jgi:probable rRNA maturation factor
MKRKIPNISVRNLQRRVPVDLAFLNRFARSAIQMCLERRSRPKNDLENLREVLVLIVSDRRMISLHRRFLAQSGPTDVITFQHGEIVIAAGTARDNACRFKTTVAHELCLYLVHGLLHLQGADDRTQAGARKMQAAQKRILARVGGLK